MELSDEQRAVRDVVREFAVEEVRPTARAADREQTFPEDVWDGLAELDLTGLTVPGAYGGFDADRVTYSLVNEALAYGSLSVATALSVHCLATSCIAEFGDEDQRARWLPQMVDGRPVGAFALSEPGAGSNPAQMETVARPVGGDHDGRPAGDENGTANGGRGGPAGDDPDAYVIDGKKQWITNGERAGVVVLFAKTDPGDPRSITQFLVPKDADGLEVGKKEDKLGLRASDTTSLVLDGVRIPAENRLTPEGEGLSAAFSILQGGRIGIASQAVGLAEAAFDEAVTYAGEREQFGGPIADVQTVRHRLADMKTSLEAARTLTREAARRDDHGEPVELWASMAKYFASETAMDVTNEAVQLHGGYGYVTEFDVERYYRDAKVTTIYEGTSEIQKKIVARNVLD